MINYYMISTLRKKNQVIFASQVFIFNGGCANQLPQQFSTLASRYGNCNHKRSYLSADNVQIMYHNHAKA